jgi:hypothetical protein
MFGGVSIFLLFFNWINVILILLAINTTLPENFYYFLRMIASLVLNNIPNYEEDYSKTSETLFFYASKIKPSSYQKNVPFRLRRLGLTDAYLINFNTILILATLVFSSILFARYLTRVFTNK